MFWAKQGNFIQSVWTKAVDGVKKEALKNEYKKVRICRRPFLKRTFNCKLFVSCTFAIHDFESLLERQNVESERCWKSFFLFNLFVVYHGSTF